jgi:hypothetical protein
VCVRAYARMYVCVRACVRACVAGLVVADILAKDQKKKNTPLHVACEKGFIDVIKLLVEAGSDPKVTNRAG